jgi:hypothetical protein
MKKTFISFLAAVYVLLMLSTTVERLCFENSKSTSSFGLSDCEGMSGDNEEPSSEDNREYEDDGNIKVDFSYGLQKINSHSNKHALVYCNLKGFHFSEIDSPPPQG